VTWRWLGVWQYQLLGTFGHWFSLHAYFE
jgi:hypothetical protein